MQSILIVEDEKRVADLLKTGLEENGYRVTVAYDGAMGLRLFRAQPFQLVVSDVVLPRMDGFELCREIRRIHASVPILMLTALGTTDDKLDGFDAGADDYMVKPFDFRELTARIRALLKRQRDAEPAPQESLRCADLRIDTVRKEVYGAAIRPYDSRPRSTGCWSIWPNTPEGSSAARRSPNRCGRRTLIPGRTSSTSTSTTCARRWTAISSPA